MKRRYQLFADKVSRIKSLMPNAFIGIGRNGRRMVKHPNTLKNTCFPPQLDVSQLQYLLTPNVQAQKPSKILHCSAK